MSASRSPQPSSSQSEFVFRLPRRALRIAGIAFAAGLLLFVLVWWLGRDKGFYKPEPVARDAGSLVDALPEPMSTRGGASGMEKPADVAPAERPQLVQEPVAAPAPSAPPPTIVEPPVAPVASGVPLASGESPQPRAGFSPAPEYPASAIRRGDSGTVLLRVDVDAEGNPTKVRVEQRSGSRALDRAAVSAVKRWKFNPGQRDGQPIPGSVTVPVDFTLK
ncbi:energy transducer TonB [Pseudoxanthomonas dokdonensis]|uniref:TonB C-terminal domain-containing protein n=1 Tax=Pseudoxanthomonas dokdonensis TaxID=344882 RepID=A0A0R0D138_9GAMM|nr:energy transducer TonB [Pseudoxanthomonas dokdonensis]KRG71096.1 hypothetical protein ABB29_04560 [Pseudoxanthomonas dokdonensis]